MHGGEDESCDSEEQLLRENGHQVDSYQESNHRIAKLNPLALAGRTIWSQEAYRTVECQLATADYDLIHVQNFFPLISPSVYYAARSRGVPVVQTLRNYRLMCPNGLFFRDGRPCEDCVGKFFPYPGVINRCYRNSLSASSIIATMLSVHLAYALGHNR